MCICSCKCVCGSGPEGIGVSNDMSRCAAEKRIERTWGGCFIKDRGVEKKDMQKNTYII